jgi:hypothetical protein
MFIVAGAQKKCRMTIHPYIIKFDQCTMIQEVTPQPDNFPLFAFYRFDLLEAFIPDAYFKVSFILHYRCHRGFSVSKS